MLEYSMLNLLLLLFGCSAFYNRYPNTILGRVKVSFKEKIMSDIYSKSKRSDIMSKIPSKETQPEILVRKYLFSKGFRFRKNVKELPGKPDIVLPKYKIAIFIHGCFWHGHSCRRGNLPSSNRQFWESKISQNISRDEDVVQKLQDLGWKVIIIWQCEIQNSSNREIRLNQLVLDIRRQSTL